MCNASIGFYRNAKQEGIEIGKVEGIEIGKVEGRAEKTLELIVSLMRNGGVSKEEAMDLLSVPEEERAGLLERLS